MAGIEMKGFEDLKRDIEKFSKVVQDEAIQAAEDAAAQVVKAAVEAAAPRDTGQLASSIQVFESRDRKALTGQARRRLLIGPEKKKGFYGFFLQKGWIWSKGRRKRAASGNTHSQSGPTEGSHRIPPHPWFPDSAAIEARARAAGEAAFMAVVETELGSIG
jgi:HK97 gp10 family phage protein